MARPRHLPLYSPPSHSPLHVYFLVYLLSNLLVLYPVCTPWLATKLLTSCNYVNIFFHVVTMHCQQKIEKCSGYNQELPQGQISTHDGQYIR